MARHRRTIRKKKGFGVAGLMRVAFFLLLLVSGAAAWLVFTPFGPAHETFVELAPGSSTIQHRPATGSGGRGAQPVCLRSDALVEAGNAQGRRVPVRPSCGGHRGLCAHCRGDVYTMTVTIPEGANIFEIATRLEQAGLGSRQDFLDAATKRRRPGGRPGPRSEKFGGLPVSGHLSFCPQGDSGADLRGDGAALPRGGRVNWD